jgi:CheY-like chemotaxis protein
MMDSIEIAKVGDTPVANAASKEPTTMPQTTDLVCEDEALIRIYLIDLLEEMGYTVVEAVAGGSAIEQMPNSRIDFLITDLGKADMPGIEVGRRLRSPCRRLPVLFATGRSSDGPGLSTGNTGYLGAIHHANT